VTNRQTFFRSPKVLKLKLESKQNQLSWRDGLETTDAEGKKSLTLPDFVNSTLYHKLNLCNGLSLKDLMMAKIKVKYKPRDPESKAKLLSLFEQGKGIDDTEVKALGYKTTTLYNLFSRWQFRGAERAV